MSLNCKWLLHGACNTMMANVCGFTIDYATFTTKSRPSITNYICYTYKISIKYEDGGYAYLGMHYC